MRRFAVRRARAAGFGLGVALVVAGVLLQLPDVAMLVDGMRPESMWTPGMVTGMLLLALGAAGAAVALFAGRRPASQAGISLDAIEHGRLRPRYWATCVVLTLALVVDIMKPLTLGFVLPGMGEEYGMPLSAASVLPLTALTGTAVGSVVWGLLGDRYGRQPAFLFATVLFIATSACGAMPSFGWNLVMCFIMGTSAGGLLPLAFTLIAELAPRRHRGWMAVVIGVLGGLGGYLAASVAAYFLEPAFTWRALWLIGAPTGLLLLALMPLVPESPLFLLRSGRREQAEAILRRYGSHLGEVTVASAGPVARPGIRALLRRYPRLTAVIGVVGVVWGLVNFGFLVMLPAQLRAAGASAEAASGLLARSALYSAPALLAVVALYVWSARRSLALFAAATGLALAGVGAWSVWGVEALLLGAVGMLVLALSAVNAMLLPYSAEIYPTALRATGSGFAAAATKVGGILGPFVMLLALRFADGLRLPSALLAALSVTAAALMLRYGREPVTEPAALRSHEPPVGVASG